MVKADLSIQQKINLILPKDASLQLRSWRDDNVRMSKETLDLWSTYIAPSINRLGDES